MWWQIVVGVAVALVVVWLGLLVTLWTTKPDSATITGSMRLLPDVLRLITRLARDTSLHWGVRLRLWLLLAYLAMPIDVVPDFIPVIGYADDVVIVSLVLRAVVRRSGRDAIERHWPGSPDGLAAVLRLARLT